MEPHDAAQMRAGPEADEVFLLTTDGSQALRGKAEQALARVPLAVGVNNHMGSRFTERPESLRPVMELLAARGLAFLDSRTTASSSGLSVADQHGVPAVERHVFLDADPDPSAIREALLDAGRRALNTPTVAIAHPDPAVVEVLRAELPGLWKRGIAVVPLSEVVAHRPTRPQSSIGELPGRQLGTAEESADGGTPPRPPPRSFRP